MNINNEESEEKAMPILMSESGVSNVTADCISAVESGLTDVASNIGGALVVIIPIALGITGAVIAVKFGIKFFRSLTSKN